MTEPATDASRSMARTPCPCCGEPLHRVRRRLVDRVTSLLQPVKRYRCENPGCGWEGNLKISKS